MTNFISKSKKFLLDLFFPKCCFGCGSERSYLCGDCLATIEILESQFCPGCQKEFRMEKSVQLAESL